MTQLGPVRPERCLFLVNPLSFRLSLPGAFARLRHHAQSLGLEPHVVYGPQEIEPLLSTALASGLDLIIIVGGDGTLQGTVSVLATAHPNVSAPPILMLGGGRTNYTAAHLGTQGRAVAMLERALTRPDSFDILSKATLEVTQADHPAVYGFFLGGALVDHVIRDCHQYRASGRGRIRQGRYSTIWRVAQLGLLGLLRRVHYRSSDMSFESSELGRMQGKTRLLVATTLDESQVTVHPYLPLGDGPVKITAVLRSAQGFWRQLPALLRGKMRPGLSVQRGYFSGHSHEINVMGLDSICVDGQEYELNPEHQTKIAAGPTHRFLSL